jgi:actin-like ATPase involved in cell morphogenesis
MSGWVLAIDYGTSFTAAATCEDGGSPQMLLVDGEQRIPSLVVLSDDGGLIVGAHADAEAALDPDRVERTPKSRLGDPMPMLLGGEEVEPTEAVGAVLRTVWEEAVRQHGGDGPREVRLTHPASWASERLAALTQAAVEAGIDAPVLIAEPVAAALHFAGSRVPVGALAAVYDLGGGTFDAAVVRRVDESAFEVVGTPHGAENLGGELFDENLTRELLGNLSHDDLTALRGSHRARHEFRHSVRRAKERLSGDAAARLALPDRLSQESMRVTREEFERLIQRSVDESVLILDAAIRDAGVDADDLSIFLAGGSSRIPLVARAITSRFGRPPAVVDEPKAVVALGAARWATDGRVAERGDDGGFDAPIIAHGVRAAGAYGGAVFVVVSVPDEDDALALVRIDPDSDESDAVGIAGTAAPDTVIRIHVTPSVVAVQLPDSIHLFSHELDAGDAVPIGLIHATAVGTGALWARRTRNTPRYDEKVGIALFDVEFARVGLSPSISSLTFGGGLDAMWVDGLGPAGWDVMPEHPGSDDAFAISSRARRGLRGWRRQQVIARLSAGLGLGERPESVTLDDEPWVRQIGVVDGRQLVATSQGLLAGRATSAVYDPSALSLVLNASPYPFAEWVLTRRGALAVTASDEETVIYRVAGDAVEPVVTYPLSSVTVPSGYVWEEVEGARHLAALGDDRGAWIPLISDTQCALVHIGLDGTCGTPYTFAGPLVPIGSDDERVYCIVGRDDGLSDVIAVHRE